MVATDKNKKNLGCNQDYSICRVEKLKQLTYSVKARLQTISHKKIEGKCHSQLNFQQTFHWY